MSICVSIYLKRGGGGERRGGTDTQLASNEYTSTSIVIRSAILSSLEQGELLSAALLPSRSISVSRVKLG